MASGTNGLFFHTTASNIGSAVPMFRSVSSNTSVTTSDDIIFVTAAATITLLLANNAAAKPVTIVNAISGGGTVTIARSGSDTILGETSQTLNAQYDCATFFPDGTSAYYAR